MVGWVQPINRYCDDAPMDGGSRTDNRLAFSEKPRINKYHLASTLPRGNASVRIMAATSIEDAIFMHM